MWKRYQIADYLREIVTPNRVFSDWCSLANQFTILVTASLIGQLSWRLCQGQQNIFFSDESKDEA